MEEVKTMTKTKDKKKIYEESGQGLVWAEFVEVGCPAKKEDYFLTEKEVLNLDIVKRKLERQKKELVKEIKAKKFERGQRQWCIQCANRICRFIEGKTIKEMK